VRDLQVLCQIRPRVAADSQYRPTHRRQQANPAQTRLPGGHDHHSLCSGGHDHHSLCLGPPASRF